MAACRAGGDSLKWSIPSLIMTQYTAGACFHIQCTQLVILVCTPFVLVTPVLWRAGISIPPVPVQCINAGEGLLPCWRGALLAAAGPLGLFQPRGGPVVVGQCLPNLGEFWCSPGGDSVPSVVGQPRECA